MANSINSMLQKFHTQLALVKALALFLLLPFNASGLEIDTEQYFLDHLSPSFIIASNHEITVSSSKELYSAITKANTKGNTSIKLKKGVYFIDKTLVVTANNISITAIDNNPFTTVIRGQGMKLTKRVNNLLRVSGSNFLLSGITLEEAGNHLIQIAGESSANKPVIRNCVFQNGYEQLLKVTYNLEAPKRYSNGGIIENSLFRYTAGIGPNYYIGGIDAHGIQNWTIKHNVFENIASPSKHIAEHAIHVWNNTVNNTITHNLIINSDRGIGFGMRNGANRNLKYGNLGGEISNNIIFHANNTHPYADVGIILEDSPETNILNNVVLLKHNYASAIEYRFPQTKDGLIRNNITNKNIRRRDNANAVLLNNTIDKNSAEETLLTRLKKYIVKK